MVILALHGYEVYCACYSKHLIERDYNDFSYIFETLGVDKFIHYGTIEQLCEKVINSGGQVRTKVEDLILNDKIPDESKSSIFQRKKILFIDEVDVFFEK